MYILGSYWIEMNQDQSFYERQTYSVLDLLGDAGGLFDALKTIVLFWISPLSHFVTNAEIL